MPPQGETLQKILDANLQEVKAIDLLRVETVANRDAISAIHLAIAGLPGLVKDAVRTEMAAARAPASQGFEYGKLKVDRQLAWGFLALVLIAILIIGGPKLSRIIDDAVNRPPQPRSSTQLSPRAIGPESEEVP